MDSGAVEFNLLRCPLLQRLLVEGEVVDSFVHEDCDCALWARGDLLRVLYWVAAGPGRSGRRGTGARAWAWHDWVAQWVFAERVV